MKINLNEYLTTEDIDSCRAEAKNRTAEKRKDAANGA